MPYMDIAEVWDKVYDLQEQVADLKIEKEALTKRLNERMAYINNLEERLRDHENAKISKIVFDRLLGYVEPRR